MVESNQSKSPCWKQLETKIQPYAVHSELEMEFLCFPDAGTRVLENKACYGIHFLSVAEQVETGAVVDEGAQ